MITSVKQVNIFGGFVGVLLCFIWVLLVCFLSLHGFLFWFWPSEVQKNEDLNTHCKALKTLQPYSAYPLWNWEILLHFWRDQVRVNEEYFLSVTAGSISKSLNLIWQETGWLISKQLCKIHTNSLLRKFFRPWTCFVQSHIIQVLL